MKACSSVTRLPGVGLGQDVTGAMLASIRPQVELLSTRSWSWNYYVK